MKIRKGGNDSLLVKREEEIRVIFQKSMDLLLRNIFNYYIIIIIIIIIIYKIRGKKHLGKTLTRNKW